MLHIFLTFVLGDEISFESINVLANVSVFLPTLKGPERISRIQQNNGSIYHPFFRDILLLRG